MILTFNCIIYQKNSVTYKIFITIYIIYDTRGYQIYSSFFDRLLLSVLPNWIKTSLTACMDKKFATDIEKILNIAQLFEMFIINYFVWQPNNRSKGSAGIL